MPLCLFPVPSSASAWAIKKFVKNPIECVEHCRKIRLLLHRATAILFLKLPGYFRLYPHYFYTKSLQKCLYLLTFSAHSVHFIKALLHDYFYMSLILFEKKLGHGIYIFKGQVFIYNIYKNRMV